MAIFGPQGIRDSIYKSYRKHLEMYRSSEEPAPEGISDHHAALHGALVLRYAFAYRPVPEAIVWLELGPLLNLSEEDALRGLAEYVVYKERPSSADLKLLGHLIGTGMMSLAREDREFFLSAARKYRFPWRKIWPPGEDED